MTIFTVIAVASVEECLQRRTRQRDEEQKEEEARVPAHYHEDKCVVGIQFKEADRSSRSESPGTLALLLIDDDGHVVVVPPSLRPQPECTCTHLNSTCVCGYYVDRAYLTWLSQWVVGSLVRWVGGFVVGA